MNRISEPIVSGLAAILMLCGVPAAAQPRDQATRNEITSEFISAEQNYESGRYAEALRSLERIDVLNPGQPIPTALNLKVKVLIAMKEWSSAEAELDRLYSLPLARAILMDAAKHRATIEDQKEVRRQAAIAEAERRKLTEERIIKYARGVPSSQPLKAFLAYERYLFKFPSGTYAAEALNSQNRVRESAHALWKKRKKDLAAAIRTFNTNAQFATSSTEDWITTEYKSGFDISIDPVANPGRCIIAMRRISNISKRRIINENNIVNTESLVIDSKSDLYFKLYKISGKSQKLYLKAKDKEKSEYVHILSTYKSNEFKDGKWTNEIKREVKKDDFEFYPNFHKGGGYDLEALKSVFMIGSELCGFDVTFEGF